MAAGGGGVGAAGGRRSRRVRSAAAAFAGRSETGLQKASAARRVRQRKKDSLAFCFPLRGTGKQNKRIRQCLHWLMHMPPACANIIRILPHAKKESHPLGWLSFLAAGEGFEPSQTESESGVLPLHNPAKRKSYYTCFFSFVKKKFPGISRTFKAAAKAFCRAPPRTGRR